MGQAKIRAKEIMAIKEKKPFVIMPLSDEKLFQGQSHGAYIKAHNIQDCAVVGNVFNSKLGITVKVACMITNFIKDKEARAFGESWWAMPENKGPKLFLWLPLDDMAEMTVSGLEKLGQGVQGEFVANLIDLLDLNTEFKNAMKAACIKNPDLHTAFNNLGQRWGDTIVA
jgi:hypothetical protein